MPDDKLVPRDNLVAVRDRREQVITALTEHFSSDVLDMDEYDRRIDLAHRARSLAELEDLVVDLTAPAASTALAHRPAQVALDRWPERKRYVAVFGGVEKKGRWSVPRKMTVVCLMGGAELDFTEADFAPGITDLQVTCVMGGAELIVPPWLSVEVDATAIFGGFEEMNRGHGEPDPERPLLRITGLAVMGGVSIETRLPGESGRQARKRLRNERKLLDKADRALPRAQARELPAGAGKKSDK